MGSRGNPGPQWWDRDVDDQGTPLRADVRRAASEFWSDARRHARYMLGDDGEAAELLEVSVVQISHDLDRRQATSFAEDVSSLLSRHFSQQLYRRAVQVGRIQEQEPGEEGLESQVEGQFDAAEVVIPWAEESSNSRSSLPEVSGCWLDRGSIDGIALRDDVRNAATAVWPIACDKTRAATGDSTETAELMEVAVMQASQYLDRLKSEASVEPPSALLVTIFNRLLWRRAALLARLQPAGDGIELKASVQSWEDEVNTGLLFKQMESHLSRVGITILSWRRDGDSWQEIAQELGTTVTAVRKRFWREIEHAKITLGIKRQKDAARGGKTEG